MTQIKLRRDTAANFTSKNPVLGVGEPAYETDTKKLKIGDGTTAYTQLEYFSSGGGGSADIGAALPLKIVDGVISLEVDGQTIQIVDGKLHASDGLELCDTDIIIRDDEKMFTQLQQMRHSTFDLSKFTVVGSPTITDDGVASKGSPSNNVMIDFDLKQLKDKSWTIRYPFNFNGINDGMLWAITIPTTNWNWIDSYSHTTVDYSNIYQTIQAGIDDSKDTNHDQFFIASYWYKEHLNEDLVYELSFDLTTGVYTGKLLDSNNNVLDGAKTYIPTSDNKQLTAILDNSKNWTLRIVAGALQTCDLNAFSITVDGKEVFSGNKTGLDVIKPDNYTVVGSPTISADGVASGFSGSDYLTVNTTGFFNNNYNFEIDSKVKYTSDTTTEQEIWNFSWIFRCRIWYTNNKHRLDFYMPYGANYTNTYAYLEDYGLVDGDDLYIKCISENASSRKLMFSKDDINWNTITNTNTTDKDITSNNLLKIGQYSPTVYWLTNIDLNAFKIYVDGDLVYQPCLKIPYTQSKTGSKIVDVAYRDRAIDLYEQEGQAGYYTIDEPNKNFTLPMGEIYGMIGQRSLISSTVTETNRVDIYSDKTCLICGNVATAGTINLPIELGNNNYFITLSTSAKTATSFTTTATGDYILIGKVV